MICYRGHQIYRTGFERIDNQGCREAALNFWGYSLLCVYVIIIIMESKYLWKAMSLSLHS